MPMRSLAIAHLRTARDAGLHAPCPPSPRGRWHPDKNPAPLRDLATEVTKMINKALEEVDAAASAGGPGQGAGSGSGGATPAGAAGGGGRRSGRTTSAQQEYHFYERD